MIGQTLGHHRILEKIGAGGMGEVYRARDQQLERDVAVKVLPAGSGTDPAAQARLLREARTASKLNHPHVCTIHEVGQADGLAYIVMEYVQGRPLSQIIRIQPLPLEQALRYGSQIADALAHAHEYGIIHRDLKSSNIVITPDGRAKLLDFGLAAPLRRAELDQSTRSQLLPLESGTVSGTLVYMAPEVLRGDEGDERSDLWALGVVLFEMATGELPFTGKTAFELSAAILYEPPGLLPARVPAGLRMLIRRCLEKDPGQRYQQAAEVRAALEVLQPGAAPIPTAPRARPSRRMLYKTRTTLRGNWKLLAALTIPTTIVSAVINLGSSSPVAWGALGKAVAITFVVSTAVLIWFLTKWSFLVYPDRLRLQRRWRVIEIPFENIETLELIAWKAWAWADWWQPLALVLQPGYAKLGEIQTLKLRGLRQVVRVRCVGLGRRKGYYLDMDHPERFLHALNRALTSYRGPRVPNPPH